MPDRLSEQDVSAALERLPHWTREGHDIVRTFAFRDFSGSLDFVNRVGFLAEEAGHHPDVDIRWNKVTLRLSTHSKGGLTALDFQLAGQIDAVA